MIKLYVACDFLRERRVPSNISIAINYLISRIIWSVCMSRVLSTELDYWVQCFICSCSVDQRRRRVTEQHLSYLRQDTGDRMPSCWNTCPSDHVVQRRYQSNYRWFVRRASPFEWTSTGD